jgi:hypothetical protein
MLSNKSFSGGLCHFFKISVMYKVESQPTVKRACAPMDIFENVDEFINWKFKDVRERPVVNPENGCYIGKEVGLNFIF